MTIEYKGVLLNNTRLNSVDSKNYIRLSDEPEENYIDFEYFPNIDEILDYSKFQIFILNNKYLNAENDFFQIYDKGKDIRIGWILSISNLESREESLIDNKHLNVYKLAAYHLLLQDNDRHIIIDHFDDDPKISDIYPKDSIFMVVSGSYLQNIDDFSINNYLPSLSKYGYYIQNSYSNNVEINSRKNFCLKFRGKNKIYLTISKFNIEEFRFINDLFSKHMKSIKHPLLRFHMLYQVVEFYMDYFFNKESERIVNDFISNNGNRNDFIESISEIKGEKPRIKKIISEVDDLKDKIDFDSVKLESDCKDFLYLHNKKTVGCLGELVYRVRNLVVHEYRSIHPSDINLFEDIISEVELLIINIIENQPL